jgi:anti-sigma factor RsiW
MTAAMNCRETIARLMDHVERRLSARDRRRFDAHLAVCPRCVEFLASYEATPGIVRRATSLPMTVRLRRRVHAAIRARAG